MGFSAITAKKLADIPGLNDSFGRGEAFLSLTEGRAKARMGACKDGRWRMQLA